MTTYSTRPCTTAMRRGLVAITAVLLGACGGAPPKPVNIVGQIIAADMVNPDRAGAAKPVLVRIFQLKTAGSFETADFFALQADPAAVLGADLLSSEEIMVRPSGKKGFEADFDPAAKFVGVTAAFRDIDNATWRALVELPDEKLIKWLDKRQMLVDVSDRKVTVQFAKPPK